MKVAFGWKAHSGWAALVALGRQDGEPVVVERRRVELSEETWAKQPYHAAEALKPPAGRQRVERGIEAAHWIAAREMRQAVARERARDNDVAACAVLVGNAMPSWTIEEILAVHFRMHRAEGVLFREALAAAARECGLKFLAIPEKQLAEHAEKALGAPMSRLTGTVATLGKSVGPPWGKDQKDAALAALIALPGRSKRT